MSGNKVPPRRLFGTGATPPAVRDLVNILGPHSACAGHMLEQTSGEWDCSKANVTTAFGKRLLGVLNCMQERGQLLQNNKSIHDFRTDLMVAVQTAADFPNRRSNHTLDSFWDGIDTISTDVPDIIPGLTRGETLNVMLKKAQDEAAVKEAMETISTILLREDIGGLQKEDGDIVLHPHIYSSFQSLAEVSVSHGTSVAVLS